jgi:nitroreductase
MGLVYDTICRRRSVRRFLQKPIPIDILMHMVNAARLAPSGANQQPCEFVVVNDPRLVDAIFPHLRWANLISPLGTPPEHERPTAYILILIDLHKRKKGGEIDAAAAVENMLLTATDESMGSCWLGSFNRRKIKSLLRIPHHIKLESVVAVGFSAEQPLMVEMHQSVKYWKDAQGVLHVPKRKLEDICFINGYAFSQND